MQDLSVEGVHSSRFCNELIKLDSSIIFGSIGSLSGFEIASAESPSFLTLVGRNPRLKQKYSAVIATVLSSLKQAEELFGSASMVMANFQKNLRIVIIPIVQKDVFVFLITTRESEPKVLAFQVSKLLERFETSS